MPDGTSQDVDVRNPGNLNTLKSGTVKEGDQIDITYSLAIAFSVEKVKQNNKP
jgi:MOSC domain-containing protein YiiM